ncbi:MAG: hypothetical protein MH472_11620 [Bacteroidia bacterium]|nr:hypothetical protein [Bacteroidia bacterium]
MKEYNGYETRINGELIEELRKTKCVNTLYVSHYFFALNDGENLLFYYNPMHFWGMVTIKEIDQSVLDKLERNCAVFINFDVNEDYKGGIEDNKVSCPSFFPQTPKIGNHYSSLGNRIVSHHSNYYFLSDFGGCSKVYLKNLKTNDIHKLLHMAVVTRTPNFIKSIFDLECFS